MNITSKSTKRRKDGADQVAELLFDMVRDAKPDQEVIDALAFELRKASRTKPHQHPGVVSLNKATHEMSRLNWLAAPHQYRRLIAYERQQRCGRAIRRAVRTTTVSTDYSVEGEPAKPWHLYADHIGEILRRRCATQDQTVIVVLAKRTFVDKDSDGDVRVDGVTMRTKFRHIATVLKDPVIPPKLVR